MTVEALSAPIEVATEAMASSTAVAAETAGSAANAVGSVSETPMAIMGSTTVPEVGTVAEFQLAFEFGAEHQISEGFLSADRPVAENVFDSNLFEDLVRVDKPSAPVANTTGEKSPVSDSPADNFKQEGSWEFFSMDKNQAAEDLFQEPAIDSLKIESATEPVKNTIFTPDFDSRTAGEIIFSPPKIEGSVIKIKEKEEEVVEEKSGSSSEADRPEEEALHVWLAGITQLKEADPNEEEETEPKKRKTKGKIEAGVMVEDKTDFFSSIFQPDRGGIDKAKIDLAEGEKPPGGRKDLIWAITEKKEGEEKVAADTLKRRMEAAQEVIKESANELAQDSIGDGSRFISRVSTRLGKLDTPRSVRDVLGIVLGRLTFPLVEKEARREVGKMSSGERTPDKILKLLQKVLLKSPPLKRLEGEMVYKGSLSKSELKEIDERVAVLAQEGAKHVALNKRSGVWEPKAKKESKHPVEVDEIDEKARVNLIVDREKSPWYTGFAERAEARARRKART
ncbi:hypothetical protein HY439_03160 [Candidatus Microgenomates bacterium]|nr:hypothetical protein [Candidatus Microgenomates bacterium]